MCPLKDMEWWNCSSANISSSPFQSYWKANEKQRLPEPHVTVHSLASAGMVLIRSGSPKPSASLTNWIKLHWWKTSFIPLWTPRSAGLGRNSRLIMLVLWSWDRGGCSGWSRRGDEHGLARREQQHLLPPDDTYLTLISCHAKRKWAVVQTAGGFPFGTLSHSFFYFILSPRFQVRLQTQKCVSPLSAEKGFMCSADYCMSLFSTESKL